MKSTTSLIVRYLATSVCVIALASGQSALAQDTDSGANAGGQGEENKNFDNEIVVSASRIDRDNFDAPTPVIKFGEAELAQGFRGNVALALQDSPQFKASVSPANTGGSTYPALSPVDLRGLSNGGQPRTLVLVDGRRYIGATTYFGGGDLSLIPSSLVKRVDVVTGGASAAWGSGAVAGVANVIIDEKLDGFRVGARAGISSRGDNAEQAGDIAFGSDFAGGRGHILVGGEYIQSDGITPKTARANAGRWALVGNPNYTPTNGEKANILSPNVGIANVSWAGLILSGVNAGKSFTDNGLALRDFNSGRVTGSNAVGGEQPSLDDVIALAAPYKRYAALGRLTYELSDSLKVTAELRHARVYGSFDTLVDVNRGNISISVDNAFLPTSVRDQMIGAGETSFSMGRFNADFAQTITKFERESTEATLALDGKIGDNWRWSASYVHGKLNENTDMSQQRIIPNFNRAVDAVIDPGTGSPACRVNVDLDPGNNDSACVPINIFGLGNVSQQARDYVLGTGYFHAERTLDAFGLNLRGEPVSLWAGPVSVAVGAEVRRDSLLANVSANDRARVLGIVNQAQFPKEHMWTKEGFAEVIIPLLRDVPLAQLMEFQGAARITDDLSGSVWSWKLGLTNKVSDDIRLRFAHSRDIRSPSIAELFAPIAPVGLATLIDTANSDPSKRNDPVFVQTFSGRAGPLLPETSDTTSFGTTLTPSFIPGLSISADYYTITIDGAIGTVTAQNQINGCAQGIAAFCAGLTRNSDGVLTQVVGSLVNLSQFKTSGIDGAVEYKLPVPESFGTMQLQSTVNWVRKFQTTDPLSGTTVSYLGMTGSQFSLAVPRVRWNTTLYYAKGDFQANLRTRFISKSKYDRNNNTIQNNSRPAFMYLDLGVNWDVQRDDNQTLSLYFNVNNLLDKAPPPESRNTSFYDVVGRFFVAGARVKF
ncbi:TonB-dependent receptor plug domain-containing protein [Sphingosinicella xenopeptidilytica]|uniref:TonB-dependent receptor plug domain-containing protein n=1 Tax=Sphingosinicella xenopeptidilytica TaxID=364098 RepID=A0ABW3C3F8_SPHXN